MTVGELKEILESIDDHVEVRLAFQPRWPFEYSIDGAKLKSEILDEVDEDDEEEDEFDDSDEVLYLTEGSQLGYTSKNLWD